MLKTSGLNAKNYNNDTFTYVAIPVEAIETVAADQLQSVNVTQNLILKTLPDGNIQLIDSNNILSTLQPTSELRLENNNANQEAEQYQEKKTYVATESKIKGVRYLKCKLPQKPVKRKKTKPPSNPIKCLFCEEVFDKMVNYQKHMQEHRNMKKYRCDQCSASYNVEVNLKLHKVIHSKGPPVCPLCDRKFQRVASLKAHLILHQEEESFTCLECHAEYEKEEELTKHIETHRKDTVLTEDYCRLPLCCSYCGYLFNDAAAYKEHIQFHIKIKKLVLSSKRSKKQANNNKKHPHQCNICQKSFPKVSLLDRHARIHSGEKPFVCQYCNRGFAQNGTLQIHLSKHKGLKPYHCTLCPAKFNQKGNLRVHVLKTHTAMVPGEKVYRCNLCTCIFQRVASLNGHITKAHCGVTREMDEIANVLEQLRELEKKTTSATNLTEKNGAVKSSVPNSVSLRTSVDNSAKAIVEGMEQSSEDNMDISYIRLADSSVDGVIRHYEVLQRKEGDVRWYICSYCNKEFKKPSDLIRHIRVHTREKPFACKQCGQTFSLKSTLVSHLNTHAGKRENKCMICLKMFTSVRTLNVHFRKHSKNNASKSNQLYKCTVCNKIFNSITRARIHMSIHTRNSTTSVKQKALKQPMVQTAEGLKSVAAPRPRVPYAELEQFKNRQFRCNICVAAFKKSMHLKRHLLTHTGEKKFKCDNCLKSFYTSSSLKEHMKFHSGIKNYVCKVCNKRFVTNAILNRHSIIHSSYRPYICPYCQKSFKTVVLCRKHIKTHSKDEDVQPNDTLLHNAQEEVQMQDALSATGFDGSFVTSQKLVENASLIQGNMGDILQDQLFEMPENATSQTALGNEVALTVPIADNNQMTYNTVYIKSSDLQSLNGTFYSGLLPQLKLQNDSVFLNELPDASVTLPVDTLPNAINYQSNQQTDTDMFTTTLLPTTSLTDDENNTNFNTKTKNLEPPTPTETLSKTDALNLPEGLLIPDGSYLSCTVNNNVDLVDDLNAFNLQGNTISVQGDISVLPPDAVNIPLDSSDMDLYGNTDILCSMCQMKLPSIESLPEHKCFKEKNIFGSEDTQQQFENVESASDDAVLKTGASRKAKKKVQFKKVHTKSRRKTTVFTCPECNIEFEKKNLYMKHLNEHKNEADSKKGPAALRNCSYCSKQFKKPSDLQRHIRTHTGEKPFSCNKCGKSFSLKSTLESHSRTHNPSGNKEFNCHVCNSYFSSKASLKVHLMSHSESKPHGCRFCTKKFRTPAHRKSHEATHTKHRFLSDCLSDDKVNTLLDSTVNQAAGNQLITDAVFIDNANLPASEADVTLQAASLTFQPDSISQTIQIDPLLLQQLQDNGFLLQDNLDDSLALIHLDMEAAEDLNTANIMHIANLGLVNEAGDASNYPEQNPPVVESIWNEPVPKPKEFECDICGKRYNSKAVLRKHKKIHGADECRCSKCNKGFKTKQELEKHLKLHSGYRPFSCQLCTNSFSEEHNLKTHMRRIHQIVKPVHDNTGLKDQLQLQEFC